MSDRAGAGAGASPRPADYWGRGARYFLGNSAPATKASLPILHVECISRPPSQTILVIDLVSNALESAVSPETPDYPRFYGVLDRFLTAELPNGSTLVDSGSHWQCSSQRMHRGQYSGAQDHGSME